VRVGKPRAAARADPGPWKRPAPRPPVTLAPACAGGSPRTFHQKPAPRNTSGQSPVPRPFSRRTSTHATAAHPHTTQQRGTPSYHQHILTPNSTYSLRTAHRPPDVSAPAPSPVALPDLSSHSRDAACELGAHTHCTCRAWGQNGSRWPARRATSALATCLSLAAPADLCTSLGSTLC
jgi:hypothetical protein